MNPARPLVFWIVTLALVALAVVLLHQVLLPFVAGMALAYLLDPLVNRLERVGMNRAAATLLILGLFILAVISLLLLGIPIIGAEIAALIEHIPAYIKRVQALVTGPSHPWISKIIGRGLSEAEQSSGELASMGAGWLTEFLHSMWSDGRALISIFSLVVRSSPLIWSMIGTASLRRSTLRFRQHSAIQCARSLAKSTTKYPATYVAKVSSASILAAYYVFALRSIGLNHALLIGLVTGLISFVPYLGSLTGLVLSVSVAIAQFGPTWTPILVIVGVFFVGQSLADYVLAPYLVGTKIHLNPVWLIFALFAFGYLFGLVGLLIAVPLAASIAVLARFALKQSLGGSNDSKISAEFRPNGDTSRLPSVTPPRPP